MQFDSQRFKQNKETIKDGEIEQYFGKGNLFEQQKVSGGSAPLRPAIQKHKEPFEWLSKLEAFPVKNNAGFLAFLILIGVLSIVLLVQMEWGASVNGVFMVTISYVFWKKMSFSSPETMPHYLSNSTITWKALLKQIPVLSLFFDYSRQILVGSILLLAGQALILDLILPSSMTLLLHGIAYYGVFLGIMLGFAKQDYSLLYQSLTLYGLSLIGQITLYVFLYGYLHVFSAITFIFVWTIASFFNEWANREREEKLKKCETVKIGN